MAAKLLFTLASYFTRQSLLCFYYRLVSDSGMHRFRIALHPANLFNISVCIAFVFLRIERSSSHTQRFRRAGGGGREAAPCSSHRRRVPSSKPRSAQRQRGPKHKVWPEQTRVHNYPNPAVVRNLTFRRTSCNILPRPSSSPIDIQDVLPTALANRPQSGEPFHIERSPIAVQPAQDTGPRVCHAGQQEQRVELAAARGARVAGCEAFGFDGIHAVCIAGVECAVCRLCD